MTNQRLQMLFILKSLNSKRKKLTFYKNKLA